MDRPAWQGWRTAAVVVGVLLVTLSIGFVVTIQLVLPDQVDGDPPADEPRGVAGTFGSTVAASGSPTPSPSPSATAATVPSPPPVSYPASADEYATALLDAWLAGDAGRIAQLATPAAITLMGQDPGGLPGGWEFFECWYEPLNPCRQLRNDRGDTFGVQVDPALLGQPKAVTRVYVDLIRYETAVLPYVQYVLDAWSGANDERVAHLIDGQAAVWFFTEHPVLGDRNAFDDYRTFNSQYPGFACVQAHFIGGEYYLWRIDSARLGQPHALVWAGYEALC